MSTTVLPAEVTRWAPYTQQAQHITGVPSNILLALIDQESGGDPNAVSSAGARGLTQFIPETAKAYQVNTGQGGEYSQIVGAARYLEALGFSTNPRLALEKYNGAPGSQESTSYAQSILEKAAGLGTNVNATTTSTAQAQASQASTSSNPLSSEHTKSIFTRILLYAVFALGGIALVYIGTKRASGAGGATEQ